MTEPTAPPPVSGVQAKSRPRRSWSRRRWRRAIEIGCLPLTLVTASSLIFLFALLMFRSPPPWIYDPRSYIIGGRLGVAATVLFVMQFVYNWMNGLLAANTGAQAARGQGMNLRKRLRIVQGRFFIPILATALLRIGIVFVIALAYLYGYTRVFGLPIAIGVPGWIESNRGGVAFTIAMLGVLTPYWLIGPFLRVRFSAALGAFTGIGSFRSDERTSLALSARLGIGLAGLLALMWGGTILLLVILAAANPASRYMYGYYNPYQSPQPPNGSEIAAIVITTVTALLGSQLVFSELLVRLTQRRLAGMRWPVRNRGFAAPDEGSLGESTRVKRGQITA